MKTIDLLYIKTEEKTTQAINKRYEYILTLLKSKVENRMK